MANQEHLERLLQGVEAWNRWRQKNPTINPDLIDADLSGALLSSANLSNALLSNALLNNADLSNANLNNANVNGAILSSADLSSADLSSVNLSGASLSGAILNYANLSGAILSNADFDDADFNGADLSSADLSDANLDDADLSNANLSNADLISAILNYATLNGAILSNADLSRSQALGTNFNSAVFTGACIEDWHINFRTNLQDVTCEYIFTRYDYKQSQFTDRRPHDPNQTFAPGEFTKRYQIVLETVDLFFNDGIDWKSFLASIQELQTQYGDELSIRDIGKREGGTFLVQLEVPPEADKGVIERKAKELYATNLQILEAKYHAELQAKDKEIESYRRESANMMEIAKLLASKPITIEAKAEAVVDNQSKNTTYNMQGSKFGGGFATEGGIQVGGQFIDASSKQNLVEAAQEIQQLLDQLSTTYPTMSSTDRMMVAAKAVEEIEKNPALKQRVIGALKAGGTEALKELVDHPAVNILLATIEGWQNPS